jgi:hypothetical protein
LWTLAALKVVGDTSAAKPPPKGKKAL